MKEAPEFSVYTPGREKEKKVQQIQSVRSHEQRSLCSLLELRAHTDKGRWRQVHMMVKSVANMLLP